jgi:hypothetical protein
MAKHFSDIINEIMPLVKEKNTSDPFVVYRKTNTKNEPWFIEFPYPNEDLTAYIEQVRILDPFANLYKGADLSGDFEAVYDRVLYSRLRKEYSLARSSGKDTDRLHAITCFMQDRIDEFSQKAKDYLTTLDRPLDALAEMCPYSMTPEYPDQTYDEDLAFDAIHYIESEVNDRLRSYPDESLPESKYINGYEEKQNVTIGNIEIVIAENLNADSPYLVCNRVNGEDYNHSAFTGYIQAMGEFLTRQTELFGVIQSEREQRGEYWFTAAMMTAAHCLPDSNKEDFTGKLIVIKPSEVMPEYRYADFQLVQCTHGNGARPNAIGTSVFGKELYSGESVVYGRHQILGIADEGKLPQWAVDKLAEQRGEERPPAKKPGKEQIAPEPPKPAKAARTEERPQRKPSILGDLDAAIEEAAQIAERKGGSHTKKRGDMEVD